MTTSLHPSRGYSLADTMIAAAITWDRGQRRLQLDPRNERSEEIAWRVSRGTSLLENATALYALGLEPATVLNILPADPNAEVTFGEEAAETISGLELQAVDVSVTTTTADDTGSWTAGSWTGGGNSTPPTRTTTAKVYRSPFQLVAVPVRAACEKYRRVPIAADGPGSVVALPPWRRKSCRRSRPETPWRGLSQAAREVESYQETATDLFGEKLVLNMGPSHPATHGVLRLVLELDGEVITAATPEVGYLHRGDEKIAENMHYNQFVP